MISWQDGIRNGSLHYIISSKYEPTYLFFCSWSNIYEKWYIEKKEINDDTYQVQKKTKSSKKKKEIEYYKNKNLS